MPLKRTPPKDASPLPTLFATPLQHYASDSNVAEVGHEAFVSGTSSMGNAFITTRNVPKRKRGDSDQISKTDLVDMFSAIQLRQDEKFDIVLTSINEVKLAVDSLSSKYDEALLRINALELENKNAKDQILDLQSQVQSLQHYIKSTSIELKNIPRVQKESKDDLINIICSTAQALSLTLQSTDIKNIYRINTKSDVKPIIVDFTTVSMRDLFINSFKKYNKENQQDKLNTNNINVGGTRKPVFISENLTQQERQLHYKARMFAKNHGYTFCWTSFGTVFLRKHEGSPQIRVSGEGDLDKLLCADK